MIKDNQKTFNRFHIFIDALLITGAFLLAYPIRFDLLTKLGLFALQEGEGYLKFSKVAGYIVYVVPGYLLLYAFCSLYKPKRGRRRFIGAVSLFQANALGALYFAFIVFIAKEQDFSRGFFIVFLVLNMTFGLTFRYILAKILRAMRKRGFNQKHILIIGYSRAAEGYIDRLRANPDWGYHAIGILDDYMAIDTTYKGVKVIGEVCELQNLLDTNDLDEIVITLNLKEYDILEETVKICEKSGVHTKFVPDYNGIIASNPYMEDLYGLPVINIRNVPLSNTYNKIVKRFFDLLLGTIALVIAAIPMLIIALLVKLTSKGPIIYKQARVGLHNREFNMYKFRSMAVYENKSDQEGWTTRFDSRVTKVGKLIRKTSLDELPQIINVLKGNMSLVGPRPERPLFVEKFKEEIPRYMIKHQVRPGMTGWAQIHGYRGDTSIKRRIQYDLYYIENWSLGLDAKIMFLTIFKGFVNKNAY